MRKREKDLKDFIRERWNSGIEAIQLLPQMEKEKKREKVSDVSDQRVPKTMADEIPGEAAIP